MTTRSVLSTDFAEWLRLRLLLWPDESAAEQRGQMERHFADADQAIFVLARPSGSLGGFIELSLHPRAIGCETPNVAYVEGWFVEADLRGKGCGRLLMCAAEQWGRERGASEIASDTLIDNRVSLAAHLRLGFADVGRLIHFAKRL